MPVQPQDRTNKVTVTCVQACTTGVQPQQAVRMPAQPMYNHMPINVQGE